MSQESTQEQLASDQQRQSMALQSQLSGIITPNLRKALGAAYGDIGNGYDIPKSIDKAYGLAKDRLNESYTQQGMINKQAIGYQALRSGQPISQGEIQGTMGQAAFGLEQDRGMALRNLSFQRAQAGMGQYNTLLSQIGMGGQIGMGLASGNMSAAVGANQMTSNQSSLYGALGGAASGAAMGSVAGPWGTAAGAVVGGALGYFGAG